MICAVSKCLGLGVIDNSLEIITIVRVTAFLQTARQNVKTKFLDQVVQQK